MFASILKPSAFFPTLKHRGSVLFLVLWTLLLLATFAIILNVNIRQKLELSSRLNRREKIRYIAEAGVKKAITTIQNLDFEIETFIALQGNWSHNAALYKDMQIGEGFCSIHHNLINPFTDEIQERFGFVDEESKININRADENVIRRLFRVGLGWDAVHAQNLAAFWRDKDSQLSIPVGSAEDRYYRNLRFSYESKDSPFQVLDELLLIRDIDQDIYDQITPYITIYGDGKVNVNTASSVVLLALGLGVDVVEKLPNFEHAPHPTQDPHGKVDVSRFHPLY